MGSLFPVPIPAVTLATWIWKETEEYGDFATHSPWSPARSQMLRGLPLLAFLSRRSRV